MESGSCGSSQLMSSFMIVKLEILRKMKKIYVLFISSLLLFSCAKDDISKPSEWPEWPTPSKPKIENAVLRGGMVKRLWRLVIKLNSPHR